MDQKQGPSLLEYARFHGLANPSSTVNPLEYIDRILENSPFSKDEPSPASNGHTTTPWESIKRQFDSEKLNLSKYDARLLSTVIRDMRAERVQVNWDGCLPSSSRIQGLKVELPVLTTHHESDMTTLTSSVRSGWGNETLSLLQTCLPYSLPKTSTSFNMGYEIEERVKKERLNCTKESFLLIQNARKCGDIGPAMDCLEAHLQTYEQAFRGSGPALTPIDFDELYSPSPSPKPQMLPSPVSSNPIKRHESPPRLQKTGALDAIPLEFGDVRGTRARGSEDEQSSNAQREEEVSSFQEYSMPVGQVSSGFREMENTEDLFYPQDSTLNLAQAVVSTRPDVELAPDRGFSARRQPTCSLPTLQPDPCFTYREAASDRDIDVGHSVEVEQGTQHLTEGKILETPKPAETSHRSDRDSMVDDENLCESNTRAKKQLITANDSSHNAISIPDGPTLVTETCRQQGQERLTQTSNRQQKRKERDDHKLKSKQHRDGKKRPAARPPAEVRGLDSSSPFTALGSLPAFMETRCIAPKRRVTAERPYFATKNQQQIDRTEPQELVASDQHAELVMQCEERVTIKADTPASHHIPQYSRNNQGPPLLFLSTSLLKSHLRLTRTLENTKDPQPRLIYRDYDIHTTATNKTIINHNFQHEADIIISPSTGIILTTSQATTQLHLPGHKTTHPHLDGIKGINSPLRERIMLVAPRYERLYVLVSHAGGTAREQPTADERTLASMTSFTTFCNSVSEYSTIIPLIVAPSTPEIMAQWILGLAYKHPFRLPETSAPRSIGFTRINPSINKSRIDPATIETETQWELFLRRAGLNPFAAQIVLLVLGREEDKRGSNSTYDQATVPALSRFAEMSNETRRCLFAGLIGERVLKRVKAILNNDWQCD